MDWTALVALLRRHTKKTIAGVIAVFVAGSSVGGYMLYAEQCHAQTTQNEQDIKGLLEYQRGELLRQKTEAQQEREKWRKVVELCLAGIITDQKVCAEATAALK